MSGPRANTGIRFPVELLEQLRVAADDRDVSINWLVNHAVKDFLPRLRPAGELSLTYTDGELELLDGGS